MDSSLQLVSQRQRERYFASSSLRENRVGDIFSPGADSLFEVIDPRVSVQFLLPPDVVAGMSPQEFTSTGACWQAITTYVRKECGGNADTIARPVNEMFARALVASPNPIHTMEEYGLGNILQQYHPFEPQSPTLQDASIPLPLQAFITETLGVTPRAVQIARLQRLTAILVLPEIHIGTVPNFARKAVQRDKQMEEITLAARNALSLTERVLVQGAHAAVATTHTVADFAGALATRTARSAGPAFMEEAFNAFWTPPDPVILTIQLDHPEGLAEHMNYWLVQKFNSASAVGAEIMATDPATFDQLDPRRLPTIMNSLDQAFMRTLAHFRSVRERLPIAAERVLTPPETYFIDGIARAMLPLLLGKMQQLHATADPILVNA